MEALTRLVADSLARHGFDRPVDFRRLQWSRWFHCDSHHSLLYVPSKPGVFALAEEVMDFAGTGGEAVGNAHVGTTMHEGTTIRGATTEHVDTRVEERRFSASSVARTDAALAAGSPGPAERRMLAVTQFFEHDDMAFVLDRMLSRPNPMRARLESGRYFVRFVVIEDQLQRRTVSNALNQWIVSTAEKATGLGAQFASSLELTPATGNASSVPLIVASVGEIASSHRSGTEPGMNSAKNVTPGEAGASMAQRSQLFPSGF